MGGTLRYDFTRQDISVGNGFGQIPFSTSSTIDSDRPLGGSSYRRPLQSVHVRWRGGVDAFCNLKQSRLTIVEKRRTTKSLTRLC